MAQRRRMRRRAEGSDATVEAAPRAVKPPSRLQYSPIEVISRDQVEAIHLASLRILNEIGIKILSAEARGLLKLAGAEVDEASQIVRFDPAMVEEKIALAPSSFALEARNPERSLVIGDGSAVFSAVGGPAFVDDLERGRRTGTYEEQRDFMRLIQSLDVLHQEGGGAFEALDIPADRRHLDLHVAQITLTDKNWAPWGLGRIRARDGIEMAALALGCTAETLEGRVVHTCVINTNSPLMIDIPMADGLMEMARFGQAVVVTPFTLSGAMSPITLAGALAQQNAEALGGIVLAQCVRPGAPVIYGGFTTNVDMRTGSPAFGTPEYSQAAQITGQLARRYGLPFRSSNTTGSNTCDAQAAYESQMSLWGAVMGGASIVKHAAGWLGGGLTASFEKLILDAEMLQMMARYLQPPEVDEASFGFDTIADVGHGGHFFGEAHTLARYKTAFYEPLVSDWSNYETWLENGSLSAAERANVTWKRLLKEYEEPPIDPGIKEAVIDYADRRKREVDEGINRPED
ncbi:trimethylamine methyltransferase family protein [Rhodobacteraceae bacterium NNCM2]|nr:trimethylamine methyltransferase family protein [Coraliihabitans acroporae]